MTTSWIGVVEYFHVLHGMHISIVALWVVLICPLSEIPMGIDSAPLTPETPPLYLHVEHLFHQTHNHAAVRTMRRLYMRTFAPSALCITPKQSSLIAFVPPIDILLPAPCPLSRVKHRRLPLDPRRINCPLRLHLFLLFGSFMPLDQRVRHD